jgi:hypothetical protein
MVHRRLLQTYYVLHTTAALYVLYLYPGTLRFLRTRVLNLSLHMCVCVMPASLHMYLCVMPASMHHQVWLQLFYCVLFTRVCLLGNIICKQQVVRIFVAIHSQKLACHIHNFMSGIYQALVVYRSRTRIFFFECIIMSICTYISIKNCTFSSSVLCTRWLKPCCIF